MNFKPIFAIFLLLALACTEEPMSTTPPDFAAGGNGKSQVARALGPELLTKYEQGGIDTQVLIELLERAPVNERGQLISALKRGKFFALADGHPDAALYAKLLKPKK